jgi:hypothetical protein
MDRIELVSHSSTVDSASVEGALLARSASLTPIPFRYYRDSAYNGKNRAADNSDINVGKETLYDSPADMLRVIGVLKTAIHTMLSDYQAHESSDLIASMEMQDLNKVTIQAWRPTGWFMQSPITDVEVPSFFAPDSPQRAAVAAVLRRYVKALQPTRLLEKKWIELAMMDSDPPDTMTGSPTFASGDLTHESRMAVLAAMQPPKTTGSSFAMEYAALGTKLGLPDAAIFSPCLSTRMGPLKKPVPLYVRSAGGFSSEWAATGAYNRTRFVFPAPYPVNFTLSPLYVQMSTARSLITGMWHDPESQARYIKILQGQGQHPYSIDFSGMDTGMFQSIIMLMIEELSAAGFNAFALDFFRTLYPQMGVILPNYFGDTSEALLLQGTSRPWCSGFKLTSEFDTLYGAAVLLSSMEEQFPGITKRWEDGTFTFCELGDDIMFTFDKSVDADALRESALKNWGAKLEIIHDAMFLKWMLPVHKDVPALTRSLSRFIQQTFFNEDRYTGIPGGDRPDAVLRLGLAARLHGLSAHRDFAKYWPLIAKAVLELGYVRRSSPEYRAEVAKGRSVMQAGDDAAILQYSMKVSTFLPGLIARAKFEPSAAALVRQLQAMGVLSNLDLSSDVFRKSYMEALLSPSTVGRVSTLGNLATKNFF